MRSFDPKMELWVRDECARRGIKIRQCGKAFHLTAHRIDLKVASLGIIGPRELEPALSVRLNAWDD